MTSNRRLEKALPEAVAGLSKHWGCPFRSGSGRHHYMNQKAVHKVLVDLISVLFPGCHGHEHLPAGKLTRHLEKQLNATMNTLRNQISGALEYQCDFDKCKSCDNCSDKAGDTIEFILKSLPAVQEALQTDIRAAYEGDPAARSTMEVVMSYPGVLAIIVHRIAHLLYKRHIPLIPRIMSEYAHSATGIDIHPGATIGTGFFIDHGTGVVIGETCIIGKNVKLYQGVTLGALSFLKDSSGRLVKGVKRHPEVEDNVVIYAGATILGGETIIGHDSVIGGNVWLTHSIPPHSTVYNQQPLPLIKQKKPKA